MESVRDKSCPAAPSKIVSRGVGAFDGAGLGRDVGVREGTTVDGATLGAAVDGAALGAAIDGASVGVDVDGGLGATLGAAVVGARVGVDVGPDVDGALVYP